MACCDNNINYFAPRWSSFLDFVPTVPQLYWNVDGNEQRYHLLCKQLHKLVCYADMLGMKINIDHETVDALEKEFEKFKESGFLDYYEEQLSKWINMHMPTLIAQAMKMVWFGLTDMADEYPGYFAAYIPESWQDITFDTSMIDEDYGCLILAYTDEQTYYTPSRSYDVLDEILEGLKSEINTMNGQVETNTANIEIVETQLTGQNARITANTQAISENAQAISENEQAISENENDIDELQNNMQTAQGDIVTLNTFMSSAETNLELINTTLYTNMGE